MAKKTKKPAKKTTKKVVKKKAAPKKKVAKKATKKKAAPKKKAAKKIAPKKKATQKKKAVAKKPTVKKAVKKSSPKKVAAKKVIPAVVKRTVAINPYLTFNGNCEEAFHFYKSVFGGNFPYVGRFGEMPPVEGQPIPESEKNKIMHISLPIGAHSILMGSDSSEAFGHANITGNNFSISIDTISQAEADKLFQGLSNGGKQTMPMSKTFWGSYFGMLVDKFGIQWMISFDEKPQN